MNAYKTLLSSAFIILISACGSNDQPKDEKKSLVLPKSAPDFAEFVDVKQKKQAFFDYMYPFIAKANSDIKVERDFIQAINFKKSDLSKKEIKQLTSICEKYSNGCEDLFRTDLKKELLNEINFVPASLALAQSANESSWGTSRFSQEGNNYFGQWCFSKGCGIVPNSRNEGASHEVRAFDSTLESVEAYMFNINTHSAYEELRAIRETLAPLELDGNQLAMGLIRYSERGEEYIKEVQSMIRINDLTSYDVKLAEFLK